ncbi:GerAB/ArcD/ProY family transporter [Desulforamulus ruminis]|uniref:GerAB/ArcD/ProY family transporter n=1 Tax=Desulforamulus ruminis TaxID=1564 RepID=UPI002353D560|nr:endospore germination permease [Desulforamulus ruminis]
MDKEFISAKQGTYLTLGYVVGTALLLSPTATILTAKQDAWLAPLLAAIPGLFLIALLTSLNRMYPGQSLIQYSSSILGWPGKLLALLILWFTFHLGALVLRNILTFVSTIMLFETPPTVILIFTVALTAYGVKLGIETLGRAFKILIFLVVIGFFTVHIYSMFFANYTNLLPVLSQGIKPVLHSAVNFTAFPVGEIIVFSLLIFHIHKPEKAGSSLTAGLLAGILILVLSIERSIVTLDPERSSRSIFTIVTGLNSAHGGRLLLPIMALDTFIFSICKFFICYYGFVLGTCQWFKLSDYKPLILPAGALFTVFALYFHSNAIEEYTFAATIWPVYALPIEFGIPLLLWLAAILKNTLKSRR